MNDDLVFEDNEEFTIDVPIYDDNSEEDDDLFEYTLEKPKIEDELFKDYKEIVVKANIEHNENFDGHSKRKRSHSKRQISSQDEYTWRYATIKQPEIIYDYEQFKDEYDQHIEEIKRNQGSLNETEFISQPKNLIIIGYDYDKKQDINNCKNCKTIISTQCAADKFYNKGPFTVMCLLKEYHSDDENLRANAINELTQIAHFWVIVFILIIVVGWAHFGCLNLFCPCSFCFPEDGYEKIKRYLVLNPPGVTIRRIVPKLNANATTTFEKEIYKPTETEYYLYNNLWQTVYNV